MNEPRVVESVTNECQSLGRAHESSSARAEQLIACLEGEIAKRDETIARLEPQLNRAIQANYDLREELAAGRVAVENCELFRARIAELEALSVTKVMLDIVPGDGDGYEVYAKSVSDVETKLGELGEENEELQFEREQLRAELAAIKAQEPVAWRYKERADDQRSAWLYVKKRMHIPCGHKFEAPYAAPVSETKAQGVVMPEPMKRGDEGGSGEYGAAMIRGYNACLREVASLNAAPVHQVSVPAWMVSSRSFADRLYMAGWRDHADAQHSGVADMYDELLSSAPAAPAADASDVLDQAMYTLISIGYHENSGLVHELRQALAAHSAKGVV